MRRGAGRWIATAGVVFLLVVGVLLSALPGGGPAAAGSTLSTTETGLRAAFLLLERLGFDVETWRAAPGELRGPQELLWLDGVPTAPPRGPEENGDVASEELLRRSRDLRHYGRFVEAGGILVMPALDDERLEFLRSVLAPDGKDGMELVELPADARTPTTVGIGGEWMPLGGAVAKRAFAPDGPGTDLVVEREGAVLGRRLSIGAGEVVLLTLESSLFDNAHLEREENALFLVRLFESCARDRRILFDEVPLGGWQPPSVVSLAFSPDNWLFSAHLVALFALFVWTAAWAGPFARDPEELTPVSALQRAHGLANTLASAGRWGVLADVLRRGTLERWCARRGLRPAGSALERRVSPEAEEASLVALARGDEALLARARTAFRERPVEDEDGLEALAAELGELELALSAGGGERKNARVVGTSRAGADPLGRHAGP